MLHFQGVIYHLHLLWKSTTRLVKYTPGPRVVHAAHESVTAFRNAWVEENLQQETNFNVPKTLSGTQWSSFTHCVLLCHSGNWVAPEKQSLGHYSPSFIQKFAACLPTAFILWSHGKEPRFGCHFIAYRSEDVIARQGWDSATQLPVTFLRGSVGQFWADKALPHWFIIHSLAVKLKDTSI